MNLEFNRGQRGYSLIEMVVVIVIMGILAALAVSRLWPAATNSRQAEAKQMLKHIYTMQEIYHTENLIYGCNGRKASVAQPDRFKEIGVEIMQNAVYTYRMKAHRNTFTCTATANLDDDPTDDIWQIDEAGTLVCISDDSRS